MTRTLLLRVLYGFLRLYSQISVRTAFLVFRNFVRLDVRRSICWRPSFLKLLGGVRVFVVDCRWALLVGFRDSPISLASLWNCFLAKLWTRDPQ